ncbi:LTA synthase family protein [Thermophilibacter mediterraneus]|uniref:LTA synthase family protein n=1 Tax=Thermophilibacter mediterraneus TaxID=1871031 RepID=UPI000931A0BB|nr:LTA synthase family protein [Thermophilibacter mediterraneus]
MLLAMPLAALLVLVAFGALYVRRRRARGARPSVRTLAWLVAPVAALAVATTWCALGLYEGGAAELGCLCASSLLAGAAALLRGRATARVDLLATTNPAAAAPLRALASVVAVLACTVLGFLAMELTYNELALSIALNYAAIEMAIVLGATLVLFFLLQRRGAGPAIVVALCWVIGLAQYFVARFKASALLPNDLFVLQTAAAVSGSYVYAVSGRVLVGLSCVMLAVAVCSLVAAARPRSAQAAVRARLVNLGCALASLVALCAGVTVPSYFDDLGVGMEYWYSLDYYERQGFLTTFVAVAQDLPIDVPEGYTAEEASQTEQLRAAAYDGGAGASEDAQVAREQFEELRPTVICIMNETFADLSSLDGESWGYEGPERYRSIDDAVLTGDLSVSVLGGGTCNSEFEFLTGVPLAFVGDGKYPYSLYDLSGAPSLARQFSELGYATTALHPNYASNWNRDRVYEALGFDRFLSIDDFQGAETFHSGVSDEATYEKILELLEQDDGPQLIFDVTMQNHSAYDQENIGEVEQYHIDGLSSYDNDRLSEYLACIEESDRALAEFVDELRELDRPVVLCFFGDHQPALSTIVNDALFPGEDELAHGLRTHETTYVIWANYDVAGSGQASERLDTSVCYLGALLAEAVGAPLTDYQKAELTVREELPAVSLVGTCLADGSWLAYGSDDVPASYDDLANMTYLEFASTLS